MACTYTFVWCKERSQREAREELSVDRGEKNIRRLHIANLFNTRKSSFQTYIAPFLAIFVDAKDPESAMYNNFRVLGTVLLYLMGMYRIVTTLFPPQFIYLFSFLQTVNQTYVYFAKWQNHTMLAYSNRGTVLYVFQQNQILCY